MSTMNTAIETVTGNRDYRTGAAERAARLDQALSTGGGPSHDIAEQASKAAVRK